MNAYKPRGRGEASHRRSTVLKPCRGPLPLVSAEGIAPELQPCHHVHCPPDMDLIIEAKDKEQVVFELMRTFKLPSFDTLNDNLPYPRTDENKAWKPPKKKRKRNGKDRWLRMWSQSQMPYCHQLFTTRK